MIADREIESVAKKLSVLPFKELLRRIGWHCHGLFVVIDGVF